MMLCVSNCWINSPAGQNCPAFGSGRDFIRRSGVGRGDLAALHGSASGAQALHGLAHVESRTLVDHALVGVLCRLDFQDRGFVQAQGRLAMRGTVVERFGDQVPIAAGLAWRGGLHDLVWLLIWLLTPRTRRQARKGLAQAIQKGLPCKSHGTSGALRPAPAAAADRRWDEANRAARLPDWIGDREYSPARWGR